MNRDDIQKIMYAMTLRDRADRYDFWMKKGFRRMHDMHIDLLSYWENKINNDPDYQLLAEQTLAEYIIKSVNFNNPKN
jgi:glutamate/tyrosine decarboxylase-like PLP-dependent enzyme